MEPSIFRILVVEDHADSSRAVASHLCRAGYAVRSAHTVEAAVAMGVCEPFDLLLCGIDLPDGNGADILRRILASRPITGIGMSDGEAEIDIRHLFGGGFVAHIVTPVEHEVLEATIEHALVGGRSSAAGRKLNGINWVDDCSRQPANVG